MVRTYTYKVHKTKFITPDQYIEMCNKIYDTLNDKRGWSRFGYKFIESSEGKPLNIYFLPNKELITKLGQSMDGLSCYVPLTHTIYFNIENWNGESKSTLPVDRYRTYVINHEVGHALGLDHPDDRKDKCSGSLGFVMLQMTRGPDFVSPCLQNEWPLDNEFTDGKRAIYGGTCGEASYIPWILLIILFFIGYTCIYKKMKSVFEKSLPNYYNTPFID